MLETYTDQHAIPVVR